MKAVGAVLAAVICATLGLVATSAAASTAASTAAAPAAPALVISAHFHPSRLGAAGGHVEVMGTVRHASTCQLKLLSAPALVVVYSHQPKSCATGTFSARVLVRRERGPKAMAPGAKDRATFALVARNKSSSFSQPIFLTVAEPAGTKTMSTTTTSPKSAAGSGGPTSPSSSTTISTTTTSVPVTTTTPVIVLPALPPPTGTTVTTMPPTTTTKPSTTTTSTTTAPATTAPTSTTTTLGTTTTSGTSTTTSTSTTTTAPTTTTTTVPAAVVVDSANWSGYAVSSGPFSQITGTFTVPTITSAATCTEHVAEWVGIDGWNAPTLPEDTYLIQAGVDASMTDPDTGTCTPGKFYVWPWWEILPQNETPITTVTVNAGDQVTVSISQLSGTSTWAISLTDDTDGQSFTTDQAYSGPASSGEWVVEASSTGACAGSVEEGTDICQLAPYCVGPSGSCTGPVQFGNMSVDGTQTDWWQVFMVQDNATVATPSLLGDGGFSVAYTGTQASVASPAAGGGPVLAAGSQPRDKVLRQPISQG